MRPDQAKNIDAPHPPAVKVKGLMKAALARCNALLANDALRTMSHLLRKRRMCIDPESFDTISQHLVKSALYLQCPNEEELTVQLMKAGALSDSCQSDSEELMARLVTELLPRWLQEPWALEADKFRLKLAFDCWQGQKDIDVEGVGLCVAIAIELGDLKGAKDSFAKLPSDLDLRLAFQPDFLRDLDFHGLYTPDDSPGLPALVQRAAAVARGSESRPSVLRSLARNLLEE